MRCVGIDPGNEESAFVWYERGAVTRAEKFPNSEAPTVNGGWIGGVDLVAIEVVASYGMAVGKEVFETCEWVGRFIERYGAVVPVRRVYRAEVKMHLCHSMRANDSNIRQALIDKLGPRGTKKNPGPTFGLAGDMWSALGVAITALETKETT